MDPIQTDGMQAQEPMAPETAAPMQTEAPAEAPVLPVEGAPEAAPEAPAA